MLNLKKKIEYISKYLNNNIKMNILYQVYILFTLLIYTINGIPSYMDHQVQEDYVPILGYHRIGDETTSTTITIDDFRDQIDYLTNTYGCKWITMEKLSEYIENQEKLPTKTCIITFDDGISNTYHLGLCTLNEHKVPTTWYIITDNLDNPINSYHMTWDEVDMIDNLGHDIEAHSLTHPHLETLTYSEQYTEIVDSKIRLEELGYTIKSFATPYGGHNDDTLDIIRENFVIGRDTSQDYQWKDKRPPTISYNENYDLQFFYIKPEGYTGSEIKDIIAYTGWWQFEDNYKKINDNGNIDNTHLVDLVPQTDMNDDPVTTSLGIVILPDTDDEISTKFITKY